MEVFLQANFLTAAVSHRNSASARSKWEKKRSQLHVRRRGCRSRMVSKRDLMEGELPAFRSSAPDVDERAAVN
jgi:hypothetical protein